MNWGKISILSAIGISLAVSLFFIISSDVKALDIDQGDALIVYGIPGTNGSQWRTFSSSTATWSSASLVISSTTVATSTVLKTSPTKREAIQVWQDSAGNMGVFCYNGYNWSFEFGTTSSATLAARRWFDVEYETDTGDALVVYSNAVAGTNEIMYRTKSGSLGCGTANWSAPTNLDLARTTGIVQWVKLAPDPSATSSIAAIFADANQRLTAKIWNGNVWVNEPATPLEAGLEVVTAGQDVEDFDVAYEATSSEVLAVWANKSGSNAIGGVRYATMTGGQTVGSWTTATTATLADDATNLDLAPDPLSNNMIFASIGNAGSDEQIAAWNGTAWMSITANVDTLASTPIAGSKMVAGAFHAAVGQSTTTGVSVYSNAASTVDYRRWSGQAGGWLDAAAAPSTFSPIPVPTTTHNWNTMYTSPFGNYDVLALAFTDTNGRLFVKIATNTAVMNTKWRSTEAGSDLAGHLTQSILDPAAFAFWGYIPVATTSQVAYKWFAPADSAQVGESALAAQDTAAQATTTGERMRLRMLVDVGQNQATTTSLVVALQYAAMSGTCDTSFTGESYATVTPSTAIAFYDNPSVADGATLTASTSDPTYQSHTAANQTYEELNNATNTVAAIASARTGKWDFSLYDNGAPANTTYCFRLVTGQGAQLTSYGVIPQFNTYARPTVSTAYDQIFNYGGIASSTSLITVTDVTGSQITAANDLRIAIATSSANMRFDNSITKATLGGTASSSNKVTNSSVTYEGDNSVALIDVASDFAAGDTLTINGLRFTSFNAATSTTAGAVGLILGGPSDTVFDATNTQNVSITGLMSVEDHASWDLTTTTYDNINFSVSAKDSNVQGMEFSNDGTKMYVIGLSSKKIHEYTLSRPWDISTATFLSSSATMGTSPVKLAFNSDGTKLYVLDSTGPQVTQYGLSTAWDITSASSQVVKTVTEASTMMRFSKDGTKMYVGGGTTDYQYYLSVAWDLNSLGATFDKSSSLGLVNASSMRMHSNGSRLFAMDNSSAKIYQFTMRKLWDITSQLTDSPQVLVSTEDIAPNDISMNASGTKMYMLGNTNSSVYQYTLNTGQVADAWDTQTPTTTTHFRYQLASKGEDMIMGTTTFNLTGVSGVVTSDLTAANLYIDSNQNGVVDTADSLATTSDAKYSSPTAAGSNTSLSLNGCASNYLCVDDSPRSPDGDTTYLSGQGSAASALDYTETYGMADPAPRYVITNVRLVVRARSTGVYTVTMRPELYISGTQYKASATSSLTTTYDNYVVDYATNPNTGSAWTWAGVNSLEAGQYVNVAQGGVAAQAFRVTAVWVEVTTALPPGDISINGATGLINFATSSTYRTGGDTNYLLSLTASNLASGDTMTMSFSSANASTTGTTTLATISTTGSATTVTHLFDITNSAPSVSNMTLNGGSAINLNEGTYTWATTSLLVTDAQYCSTISSVTAKMYLASTSNSGTTCSANDQNCYLDTGGVSCVATTTGNVCSGGTDTTVQYDCGFKLWYIASSTDTGTWASSIWSAAATATDSGGLTGTATNTNQLVDINSLSAFSVSPLSIAYDSLAPGGDSGASNKTVTVTNTGNSDVDPRLSGTDMSSPDDTLLVGQQQYKGAAFTYGAGSALTTSPTLLNLNLPPPTSTTTAVTDNIYWGIGIPSGKRTGSYSGTNTIQI